MQMDSWAARPAWRRWAAGARRTALIILTTAAGAVTAAGATAAAAADPPMPALPQPLALREAFELALRHNKEVQVADLTAAADRERVTQAHGDFDPRLFGEAAQGAADQPGPADDSDRLSHGLAAAGLRQRLTTGTTWEAASEWDYSDRDGAGSDGFPQHGTGARVTLRQDLLKGFGRDPNRAGIRVAQNTWRSSREGSRDTRIVTLLDVEAAYWGLFYAQADLGVRRKQLDRANRLVAVAESQVRVGQVAPIEVTRARSSAAAQAVAILDAQSRVTLLQHRLLRLLGILDPERMPGTVALADAPPGVVDGLTLAQCLEVAWQQRPDCIQAGLNLDSRETRERLARNQCLPSLELYGSLGVSGLDGSRSGSHDDLASGDYGDWEAGLLLEFPLGNRAARGAYRAARYERLRAAVQVQAIRELAVREVADALDELRTAERQIDTAAQSRALAAELLQAEERSFNLGRSDSLDVLNAQAALATSERDEVRARVSYATALANLHAVRGDFLQVKALPVEVAAASETAPGK